MIDRYASFYVLPWIGTEFYDDLSVTNINYYFEGEVGSDNF